MKLHQPLLLALTALLALNAHASPAADDAEADHLLVRYAVLVGDRASTDPADAPAISDAETDELLGWDYQRDNAEIARLFGLETIHTIQLGSMGLGAGGGQFSVSANDGERNVLVKLATSLQEFRAEATADPVPMTVTRAEIWQDGEIASAPTVSALLGERAVVTSAPAGEAGILWIVIQIDPLPLEASP